MGEYKDFSKELNRKIEEIQTKVISGEVTLLETELFPISSLDGKGGLEKTALSRNMVTA